MILAELGKYPCIKAQVRATLVALNGTRYIGTNGIRRKQTECPRITAEHFTCYEACKAVCEQESHAEVSAITLAGEDARGATIYLEGHFAACPDCDQAAKNAGVIEIIVGKPPECPECHGHGRFWSLNDKARQFPATCYCQI